MRNNNTRDGNTGRSLKLLAPFNFFTNTFEHFDFFFNQNHTKILPSARATAAERWNSTSPDITRSWNGRLVALLSQKPPVSIISIKIIYRSLKQAMQSDLVFLHYSSSCDTHEKSDASEKKKKKRKNRGMCHQSF